MSGEPFLDDLDLERVERLAQLELDEEAREALRADLGRILAFAAQMGEIPDQACEGGVDEETVVPMRWRADRVLRFEGLAEAVAAPDRREGWFVTPDSDGRT